jgi:hypothetical protein
VEVFVRRRFWFAVTAVMAASLAVGVGLAVAATPKATKLTCHLSLTTEPPAGSSTVSQPAPQGSQYGPVHCPRAGFGGGVVSDAFTVPDSGNTMGTYTQYFSAGSIKGSFVLQPQESSGISVTSFESQSWLGTVKITSGTGIYKGIKSVKAPGTIACTSPDSVHLTCTEKVKAVLPPTA